VDAPVRAVSDYPPQSYFQWSLAWAVSEQGASTYVPILSALAAPSDYLSSPPHSQGASVGAPLRALTDHRPQSCLQWSLAWAVSEQGASTDCTLPSSSLPPRHLIPLLSQASGDKIRVSLIRL
jgi:hypothetical protein